jgi:hypothetical protein
MPANKQQFPLPFSHPKCSLRRQPMLQKERNGAPVAFAGAAQNGKSVALREAHAPGSESGQMPLTTPTFVALTDLANLRSAGIAYPSTIHGWRWLYRHRHERGLDDAFRRVGRRIVVDPERYRELVRASPAS